MRKYIVFILLLANLFGTAMMYAQDAEAPKAFFVYRNDGQFNAFFYDEIDSISFSNLDADSVLFEDIVTQEIWTADTVYRIPLASIDSVGFQKLPTVYKENVVSLDGELWNYIMSVDTAAIHLYLNTPKLLIPNVGTKVVSLQTCDFFPYGFSGMVNHVIETDSCFTLDCEWIDPIEVLEQYSCVEVIENNTQVLTRSINSNAEEERELPTIHIDLSEPDLNVETKSDWAFAVGTKFEYLIDIKPTLYIMHNINDGQNRFVTGRIHTITETSIGANIYGKVEWSPDYKKHEKDIIPPRPIPKVPFISYYAKYVPSLSLTGEMAVGFGYKKSFEKKYGFQWSTDQNIKNDISLIGKPENINEGLLVSNFVGSLELDANSGIEFGLCFLRENKVFDAKLFVKPEIGVNLKAAINLPISVLEREPKKKTAKYELVKGSDNGILSTFYVKVVGGYEVSFLDINKEPVWGVEGTPIEIPLFEYPFLKKDLFPTFENINFNKKTHTLSCDVKDDLIMPTNVGFKFYDEDGKEIHKILYKNAQYKNPDSFTQYEVKIDDIQKFLDKKCTVYPYLVFCGYDIPASPSLELELGVYPNTHEASNVSHEAAVLHGSIKNEDNLPFSGDVGFLFGTNADLKTFGVKCKSVLQSDLTFIYGLSSLKEEQEYYYCSFLEMNDTCYYGETLSFTTPKEPEMTEVVNLGLSVNWRGWNVGATVPEEYGGHYAWGEDSVKEAFSWDTYWDSPYDEGNNWVGCQTTTDIAGTDKDVATTVLGEKWRMPTYEEMQELMNKCTWTWTTINGVNGYKVTSNVDGYVGNFIFLPAAGNGDKSGVINKGTYGGYWTSTPLESTSKAAAYNLYFYGETIHAVQNTNRYTGRSIRPVTTASE